MNDSIDPILRRRSIRRYTQQEVEKAKLVLLLQAAMAAPSACNSQPWEFVVVTDKTILANLCAVLYGGRYTPAAAIVICGNLDVAHNSNARFYWVQDCSAATENILLAAPCLGLGAVWIGVYPLPSVIKPVSEVLNLPKEAVPLSVVYIGYPDETKAPRTQYNEHRVYWEQYEPRKKQAKIKNARLLP